MVEELKAADDGKCFDCKRKYGEHDTLCNVLKQPRKCETCGAFMQVVLQYPANEEFGYQENYSWDAGEGKYVPAGNNYDEAAPDHGFFSCPNFDENEATCMVDGKPVENQNG